MKNTSVQWMICLQNTILEIKARIGWQRNISEHLNSVKMTNLSTALLLVKLWQIVGVLEKHLAHGTTSWELGHDYSCTLVHKALWCSSDFEYFTYTLWRRGALPRCNGCVHLNLAMLGVYAWAHLSSLSCQITHQRTSMDWLFGSMSLRIMASMATIFYIKSSRHASLVLARSLSWAIPCILYMTPSLCVRWQSLSTTVLIENPICYQLDERRAILSWLNDSTPMYSALPHI